MSDTTNLTCALCSDNEEKNLCIANCIGCKHSFCMEHLIVHRRDLSQRLDEVIAQHEQTLNSDCSFIKLNQHFEYIDKWEDEMIDLIQKHSKDVKDKLQSMFERYKNEINDYQKKLTTDLNETKNSNRYFEHDITDLAKRVQQFNQDIHHLNNLLRDVSINELNQIVKQIRIKNSISKNYEWTYQFEIKLDSTYGHITANDQYILLGWKNRIVFYNHDGTKHDETRLRSSDIYGELCDLIWSPNLQGFFILCRKSLFVYYPSNNQIELISKISFINNNNRRQFQSITSFENSLLILDNEALDLWKFENQEFYLDQTISISNLIKISSQESICSIRTNDKHLGILIQNNQTRTWKLDIFTIKPFHRIHLGKSFDRFNELNLGFLASFERNRFLFMNWETKLMRLIDDNDANEVIDYNAYNACVLQSQRKLIVNYMTHLKIYRF